jgi:transcriptional antiterminator NusG
METTTVKKVEKTNWYTLRVANNKENKIKELISMVDNFDDVVNQILVPQEKVVKLKDGKKVIMSKNLLPGYILIEFKTSTPNPDVIKAIETTKYVSGFLKTSDKQLIPLRKNELMSIIGTMESSEESTDLPLVGEEVMVIDGPFKGFNGIVSKVDENKKIIDLNVKVFGRDTPLTLNIGQIDKK